MSDFYGLLIYSYKTNNQPLHIDMDSLDHRVRLYGQESVQSAAGLSGRNINEQVSSNEDYKDDFYGQYRDTS